MAEGRWYTKGGAGSSGLPTPIDVRRRAEDLPWKGICSGRVQGMFHIRLLCLMRDSYHNFI